MVSLLECKRRIYALLEKRTGEPWKVVAARPVGDAHEIALRVPNGFSVLDVQKQGDAIKASVGAPVELIDRAGVVVVRVLTQELPTRIDFTETPPFEELGICLGFDRVGCPVYADPLNPHLLLAGCSGTGKTDASRVYLAQVLTRYPDAKIFLCDMKGSSYLPFESLENVSFTHTLGGVLRLLKDAHTTMNERIALIRKTKQRNHPFPWVVVMIDEIAELWARPGMLKEEREMVQEANSYLSSLVRIGRELKVAVWLSTQYPTREVLHNQIQSNLVNRVCLYMDNPLEYEVILGNTGCSQVLPRIPGRAFVKGKGVIQIPYGGSDEDWNTRLEGMRKKDAQLKSTEEREDTECFDTGSMDGIPSTGDVLHWQFPAQASVRTLERTGKREMGGRSIPVLGADQSLETRE